MDLYLQNSSRFGSKYCIFGDWASSIDHHIVPQAKPALLEACYVPCDENFSHFLWEMARFSLVAKTFENVDILRQNGAFFGGIHVLTTSKLVVWSWPVEPVLWELIFIIFDNKQCFSGQELST